MWPETRGLPSPTTASRIRLHRPSAPMSALPGQHLAVAQADAHTLRILLERLDLAGGAQADVGHALAGVQEDLVQVGAVDDAVGIAVGGDRRLAEGHADDLFAGAHVVHAQTRRKEGYPGDRIGEAQVIEHLENVGPELDAGADLAEGGRLFQHRHGVTVPGQDIGGGQSADAAAGDENGKRLVHREVVLGLGGGANHKQNAAPVCRSSTPESDCAG